MKNCLLVSMLLLLYTTTYSQDNYVEYRGRFTPAIKKEALIEANSVTEIMPEFCRYFQSPFKEHLLNQQLRLAYNSPGYYVKPQDNFFQIIDIIFVEIFAFNNSQGFSSQSSNDILTAEQKNILFTADLGSDISIKLKFKFKNQTKENWGIKEGRYTVTVVPETEAEFPGGNKGLKEYLNANYFNKAYEKGNFEKIQQASAKFSINENGQIIDAIIYRSSTIHKIDQIFLDAINNMPRWKPAKNLLDINVKQEFTIQFGGGC